MNAHQARIARRETARTFIGHSVILPTGKAAKVESVDRLGRHITVRRGDNRRVQVSTGVVHVA